MDKLSRFQKIVDLAQKFKLANKLDNNFVKVVQVGPRDGLQNQKKIITIDDKRNLINKLNQCHYKTIQVGSFVSPKWVPQMASSKQLFQSINKLNGVSYPCLVPNQKGMETAIQIGVKQIAVFASATQGFSKKNLNCSIKQSLQRFKPVMQLAQKNNIKVRGYVSMVMGCPFDGEVSPDKVAWVTGQLFQMGCYEVSLGDTIGKGTPQKTQLLFKQLKKYPIDKLAVHFHDTFDKAIQNIAIALSKGCKTVDSSIGGLGGCPYSMKPVGNVCTQNVALFLNKAGFDSGLNLKKLNQVGDWICQLLERPNLSVLGQAL